MIDPLWLLLAAAFPAVLINICLEEDKKRMAGYDQRLLRPTTMPRLARMARLFIRPKK